MRRQIELKSYLAFLPLIAMASLAGGCVANTYRVHRAALVAPPTPPNWTGRAKPTGVTLGNSTVLWKNVPHRSPQSDSGLYVSSTQMDANLHIRLGESTDSATASVWLPASFGFSSGAFAAAPCLVEKPKQGVFTYGLGIGLTIPLTRRWYVGFSMEGLLSSIPSHVVAYCLDCEETGTLRTNVNRQESDSIGIMRMGLIAGWDFESGRLYGGMTIRNHPTNVSLELERVVSTSEIDADVQGGPMYGMAGLGVEFELANSLSVLVQAYQPFPLGQQDLIYGPILGVTMDIHPSRS